jgi:hypothetical protein
MRPFTRVTLTGLHKETTLRDLCKRIYGGALEEVDLNGDGSAVSGCGFIRFPPAAFPSVPLSAEPVLPPSFRPLHPRVLFPKS